MVCAERDAIRLRGFFLGRVLFLLVRAVFFAPFRENKASSDLFRFRLDEAAGRRFCCRRGSDVGTSVVTVNPGTRSRLMVFLMSLSIAANLLYSWGATREIAIPLSPALAVRPIRCT